jgi:hypothetical protein
MSNAPSYSDNDPRGWCGDPKRGAAMGRPTVDADDRTAPVKLYLRRSYLDNGGYDRNGTYFGIGAPLYWCADADGEIDFMLRARDRADAKRQVVAKYPNATFWR